MDEITKFVADYWLIIVIVLSFFGWGGYSSVTTRGRELKSQFAKLGELRGKTKGEIIALAGNPTSISSIAEGKTYCQWMKAGFHIGLIFNGDHCEGITDMSDVSEV